MSSEVSYVLDNKTLQIQDIISSERTSTTLRGVELETNRSVQLKIILPNLVPGEKSLAKLEKMLSKRIGLKHENIVELYSYGQCNISGSPTTAYYTTQDVEGETLSSIIKSLADNPLTFREILELLIQLADGLDYLHANDITAYSLNPKEIIVTDDFKLKLPAFSYLSSSQWISDASNHAIITGTDYRYIAPEMVKTLTLSPGDSNSDIYLFGILAFELASGEVPFDANRETLAQLHMHESPPKLLTQCGLPEWFQELVNQCLEKDPAKRPMLSSIKARLIKELETSPSENLEIYPLYIKRNIHILFVEDNKLDQLSFARYAKNIRYPFTYIIARSVTRAKEILARNKFDVIVSDFMLPDGTGVDVVKAAKPTPTIVVTGAGREDVAAKALRAGAFDYLSKEIMHKHLIELPNLVIKAYQFNKTRKERDKFLQRITELEKISHSSVAKARIAEELEETLTKSKTYLRKIYPLIQNNDDAIETISQIEALWQDNLNRIYQITKVESEQEQELDSKDVVEAIQDVISLLSSSLELNNISFNFECSISSHFTLPISKLKFKQVILEIARNSCEAITNSKGQISIRVTPKQSVTSEVVNHPWLMISIDDTGPGIERHIAETIFEPFVTTKSELGKLGVGLSIVNEAMREAGGYVVAYNPSYGGARFDLFFPFSEAKLESDLKLAFEDLELENIPSQLPDKASLYVAASNQKTINALKQLSKTSGIELNLIHSLEQTLSLLKENSRETRVLIIGEELPYLNKINQVAIEKRDHLPIIQLCNKISDLQENHLRKFENRYLIQKPLSDELLLKALNLCINKGE